MQNDLSDLLKKAIGDRNSAAASEIIGIVGLTNFLALARNDSPTVAEMIDFHHHVPDGMPVLPVAKLLIDKYMRTCPPAPVKDPQQVYGFRYGFYDVSVIAGAWAFAGLFDCVLAIPHDHKYKFRMAANCVRALSLLPDLPPDSTPPNQADGTAAVAELWKLVATAPLEEEYWGDKNLIWCLPKNRSDWKAGSDGQLIRFRRIVDAADVHLFNIIIDMGFIFAPNMRDYLANMIASNIARPRFHPESFVAPINPQRWWEHVISPADKFAMMSRLYIAGADERGSTIDQAKKQLIDDVEVPQWEGPLPACRPARRWHTSACGYCAKVDFVGNPPSYRRGD